MRFQNLPVRVARFLPIRSAESDRFVRIIKIMRGGVGDVVRTLVFAFRLRRTVDHMRFHAIGTIVVFMGLGMVEAGVGLFAVFHRFLNRAIVPPVLATTALASRMARPSSPVRVKTLSATSDHWRFAFADLAFLV